MIGVTKLFCGQAEASDDLRYGRRAAHGLPPESPRDRGPVVVWNMTRSCNLACVHCYASATPGPAPDELAFPEAERLVEDLTDHGVPAILFSGGEPLRHPRLMELAALAVRRGARAVLSTNGLLLDRSKAERLKDLGLTYVGISLDGIGPAHDRMRGLAGAFEGALKAISIAREAGLKVGLRLTLTRSNHADLDAFFDLMAREAVPRACFYHLVDQGANPSLAGEALTLAETRAAVDLIAERARRMVLDGFPAEVLTVDNQADGPYLHLKLLREGRTAEAERALELLGRNGGASSGHGIAAVSWNGDVHPDQFWRAIKLGSVRERSFAEIWNDPENRLLMALKNKYPHLKGRCRDCRFLRVCGGGLRARAWHLTGDPWAPDPACYLTDEEIGLGAGESLGDPPAEPLAEPLAGRG